MARDGMPEFPNPICKGIEWEQLQVELHEVVVRGIRFGRRDVPDTFEASQDISGFRSNQLRSMKRSAGEDVLGPASLRAGVDERRHQNG